MPEPSSYLDLDDLARTLRRRALPILGASVLAGLLATTGLVFLGKHRADATVGMAALEFDAKKTLPYGDGKVAQLALSRGIAPPDFKTLAPRFDVAAFAEFAASRGGRSGTRRSASSASSRSRSAAATCSCPSMARREATSASWARARRRRRTRCSACASATLA